MTQPVEIIKEQSVKNVIITLKKKGNKYIVVKDKSDGEVIFETEIWNDALDLYDAYVKKEQ